VPEAKEILVDYRVKTLQYWIRLGLLKAIAFGCQYFVLNTDLMKMKRILGGLTCYEAAEILGVNQTTVARYVSSGKLSGLMVPSYGLRIESDEVARYKAEQDKYREQVIRWSAPKTEAILGITTKTLVR
jgi:excisionase family DNA binding protein